METRLSRRARLQLPYRGENLDRYCLRAAYTDYAQGQLDELEVHLQDRDGHWRGEYFPGRSETISAAILCLDWEGPSAKTVLDCGRFEIDEVALEGPPDTVCLHAIAVRVSRSLRTERKERAWEEVGLQGIAREIAACGGLQLIWEGQDQTYRRVEQREESDLSFLRRLCRDAGNRLKLADEKLIVYQGERWDRRPPLLRLVRGRDWIQTYRFRTQTHDVYRGAEVSYWHPERRELIQAVYIPPQAPPTGEMLQINQRVEDLAEARSLARARLEDKNRAEVEAAFTLVGDPRLRAGITVEVEGFGRFDGVYFVEQSRHLLDSRGGYTTQLSLLKVQS